MNSLQYINEEEIKNLFYFLADEEKSTAPEKLKVTNLIFGLENYGLPIPQNSARILKHEMEKKSEDGMITFDNFKSLWVANVEKKVPSRELTKHLFNTMGELLHENEKVEPKMFGNKLEKIDKETLIELLKVLGLDQETTPEEDLDFFQAPKMSSKRKPSDNQSLRPAGKHSSSKNSINKTNQPTSVEKIAEDMIKAIDSSGNKKITVKDFEFVVNEYMKIIK